MVVADVIVCRNVNTSYTYDIPEALKSQIKEGVHVEIPFGRSLAVGVVSTIKVNCDTALNLKPIHSILDKKPVLSSDLLQLIHWFSKYYQVSLHKAYQTVIGTIKQRTLKEDAQELAFTVPEYPLTEEQTIAIETAVKYPQDPVVLHGVTASGKTEVYMQLAQRQLQKEKSVIFLLPEIALTPQMKNAFMKRFGSHVAVIHSGLTPKQREIAWNRAALGYAKIIIGPRSAVFSPLQNIGLIILDEEHEPSYKQDNHPRYYTHTIAYKRAAYHKAQLIFGSATPSLEWLHKAGDSKQKVHYVTMKNRVNNRPLPPITVIDMRYQIANGKHPYISCELQSAIKKNIAAKEKMLILLNRRGYAPSIQCQYCGEVHTCSSCDLSYTFHKDRFFRCHRCDIREPITHICRHCKKNRLSFGGLGTQKIEVELRKIFPSLTIYRMDSDTASSSEKMEGLLSGFKNDGDLLLGTQMIAKGHHFADVTLVAVLGIDTALALPDFRASERSFQLLSQVAGRAGRAEKSGRVIIQTCQPNHYVVQSASQYDFKGFVQKETHFRKSLWYPPFSKIINIILSAQSMEALQTLAAKLKTHLQEITPIKPYEIQLVGPAPASIEKIRDYFRWNCLIKYHAEIEDEIKLHISKFTRPDNRLVRMIIDFDPRSIL